MQRYLPDPKHEAFAFHVASGHRPGPAAEMAGLGENYQESLKIAEKLMQEPKILARIDHFKNCLPQINELKERYAPSLLLIPETEDQMAAWLWQVMTGDRQIRPLQMRAATLFCRLKGWHRANRVAADHRPVPNKTKPQPPPPPTAVLQPPASSSAHPLPALPSPPSVLATTTTATDTTTPSTNESAPPTPPPPPPLRDEERVVLASLSTQTAIANTERRNPSNDTLAFHASHLADIFTFKVTPSMPLASPVPVAISRASTASPTTSPANTAKKR